MQELLLEGLLVVAIFLIPISALGAWYLRMIIDKLALLQAQLDEAKAAVAAATAKKRQLPDAVLDGLEDCTAIGNDIGFRLERANQLMELLLRMVDENEAARAYVEARSNHLRDKLKLLRSNPHSYDSDKPNQKEEAGQ